MSPRKTILRELTRYHQTHGSDALRRPSEIEGFAERPADYQKAVNQLLQDRLIQGRKDGEGHMAIGLNDHRIGDVRREIRPGWRRPGVWVAMVMLFLAAAGLFA